MNQEYIQANMLWEPYLAGVICGDGWCTRLTIGLRAKDHDFVLAFANAIKMGYGIDRSPRRDERGYWLLRTSNKRDIYSGLLMFVPHSDPERRSWLRGMFDSEGNAQLIAIPKVSPAAFQRRVAFYTTDPEIAERLIIYLEMLGFKTVRYIQKLNRNRFGTKPVIEIRLSHSREAFSRFAIEIGSSIARKQTVLDAIPSSYQPPGHHARAGRKGVATRKARQIAGGRY